MKRSEMIKILTDILDGRMVHDRTHAEIHAREVLDTVEHHGMLPPGHAKYFAAKPTDFVFVNEWEPEGE